MQPRVVLVEEPDCRGRPEVAVLATELPHDRAVPRQLVDRRSVARGDEDAAAGRVGNRVDVKVVKRPLLGRMLRRLVIRLQRVRQRHMPEAVPLEDETVRGDVDLLHDAVVDPAVLRAADRPEVGRHLVVGRDVGRTARGQLKLVQVALEAVADRLHRRDPLVRGVVDLVLALADPRDVAVALPPGEHRPAPVGLDTEVRRLQRLRELVVPADTSLVVDDQRSAGRALIPHPSGRRRRSRERHPAPHG